MKVEQSLSQTLLVDKEENQKDKDKPHPNPKYQKIKQEYFKQKHYLFGSNPFQTIFFTWISPLLKYGYRFDLEEKAIPQLRDEDKPKIDFTKLSAVLEKNTRQNKSKRQGMTLTKSLFKAFKKQFLFVFFFSMLITGLNMYSPILSHDVIDYIASGQKTTQTGLLYFTAIFILNFSWAISQTFLWYYFAVLGYNLSNTLSLLIYNKALRHPLITQKQFTVAEIINYSQVDAQRLTYMGFQLVCLFYTPIQIIFGLTLLYIYIGVSFLVGTGVMLVLMSLTLIFTKIAAKGNDQLLKAKDARMKITEEILQIIKYIKVNALEKYFFRKINKKRQAELKLIQKVNLCYVATIFLFWLCPPMIVSFTFLVYVSLEQQITAAKAFFTIIIFNILQYPIRMLPSAISEIIQVWSSIKRIQKFLAASEVNKDCVQDFGKGQQDNAVVIERGNFLWGKEKEKEKDDKDKKDDKKDEKKQQKQKSSTSITQIKSASENTSLQNEQKMKQSLLSDTDREQPKLKQQKQKKEEKYVKALHDLNVKIPAEEVTMIIGDIGSGKSSFLYAILNEMTPEPQKNPSIKIYGSVAFSPQKAWIMAGTVKDNITFFKPYDEKRFNQAIHYACLEDDLKILGKGIHTEIGQKGTNLSGGQKARISLARALYSNKDIYLLDDILSAVDVHVGKFIIQQTILGYLRGKTVIMPTHAVKYLQHANNIIIMDKGRVVSSGPYKHVSDSSEFQEIMQLMSKKSEQAKDQKSLKQQQSIVNELKLVRQATKSIQKLKTAQKQSTQVTDKIVEQLILPEDQRKGQVSLDVYLEYIKLNGGILFILAVTFCMAAWTILSIMSNIQVERWCQDEAKSKIHLYLYLVFAISGTVFSGTRAYILITSGIRQGRIVHKKMIKSLLYASIVRFYNRVPIGRILNRLSKDLREIDESIGYAVGGTFVCFFSLLASLAMCVYASTLYVMIPILFVSIVCRQLLRYYLKSQRECVRIENVSSSPIVSGFTSTVNGVATIRAYGLEVDFLNQQIERIDLNKRARIARQGMQSWFALRMAMFSFIINMSALAFSILSDNENASLIGLLLTYANQLSDDIVSFAFSYANLELRMISVERVLTFAKLEPEKAYMEYCKGWRTREEGCDLEAIKEGSIEFRGYSARYRDDLAFVIKGITLKINKGEKIGIVGRTGAGKSTLMNCLLRILDPAEGTILIDGKEICDYKVKDLRACMTMIEQEPTLINGSFRENLDPANVYSDEQINKILEQCNLAEMVATKGGLDSKATNQNLSVGQRQLLCICRAFLKKSRIILIDEATANIDVKNDKLIQEVIATAFKESTVLTIAHRLSTLHNCDKVMVLSEGKVVEWGAVSELLKIKDGIYRKMMEENDSSYLL